MDALRIVFMGTPSFAVPALQALLRLQRVDETPVHVVGVFTQPDRPAGRGRHLAPPPVKETALEAGLPVEQPERLRRPDGVAALERLAPDLIVVAAYAQILSPRVLALPRFGCLNVHASLLPRYRGAAPIQAAILDGEAETGVSIMQMEAGLDTGPVLARYVEPIRSDDTAETLSARLAAGGADLLARTVPHWVRGTLVPEPQDGALATMTRPLTRGDGRLGWTAPAAAIERTVRAMHPWPGAHTTAAGALLKILGARVASDAPSSLPPGMLLAQPGGADPLVVAAPGVLALQLVQAAGKRPMAAADWLRGASHLAGTVLGE